MKTYAEELAYEMLLFLKDKQRHRAHLDAFWESHGLAKEDRLTPELKQELAESITAHIVQHVGNKRFQKRGGTLHNAPLYMMRGIADDEHMPPLPALGVLKLPTDDPLHE